MVELNPSVVHSVSSSERIETNIKYWLLGIPERQRIKSFDELIAEIRWWLAHF